MLMYYIVHGDVEYLIMPCGPEEGICKSVDLNLLLNAFCVFQL